MIPENLALNIKFTDAESGAAAFLYLIRINLRRYSSKEILYNGREYTFFMA